MDRQISLLHALKVEIALYALLEEDMWKCYGKMCREAKRRRKRRWYVSPLYESRPDQGEYSLLRQMYSIDENMHFKYFRMSQQRFSDLLQRLEPHVSHQSTHSCPISPGERLAVALRILASGATQKSVAASFKMGSTTVCRILSEICQLIWQVLHAQFVAFPNRDGWSAIAEDFWGLCNFPNCVGAIDSKHIKIRAPPRSGSEFVGNKDNQAIVLLAMCDARYKFTMIDVGSYGDDGDVFQQSSFGNSLLQNKLDFPPPSCLPGTNIKSPPVIVGDADFPLHLNLMKPFPGSNLEEGPRLYNYRHARARSIIENSFSILTARWRILGRPIEFHTDKAINVVKACVALHNYLISTDDTNVQAARYIPLNFTDSQSESGEMQDCEWRRQVADDSGLVNPGPLSHGTASRAAVGVRRNLMHFFQSPEGTTPWQDAPQDK
ncbi:putative nuclease HARBI1 [Thalassophryne amazonica]|uniref:putative nuclease HARBI1 n=1 Tax=Thalassophryne amazonica TaxID=390379 RepID=UPI0014712552|nr:putative nuclease HARBI1 [Thalassophryne amazonica]